MSDADDARIAGRLSMAYVTAIFGEILRTFPLDFLDHLLVAKIASANVQHLIAPDRTAERQADLADLEPERVGISRNAVSRELNVPLETVRRRVAGLIEKKILAEQADGLAFLPDNPLGMGNNQAIAAANFAMLRQLIRNLKARGIDLT